MAGTKKIWTEEVIEDIYRRYQNGESYAQIGKSYGKNRDAIRSLVRRRRKMEEKMTEEETKTENNAENDIEFEYTDDEEAMETDETDENFETEEDGEKVSIAPLIIRPSITRPKRKEFGRYYTRIFFRHR